MDILKWAFGKSRQGLKPARRIEWPLEAVSERPATRLGSCEPGALTRNGYLRNTPVCRWVPTVAEAAASVPVGSGQAGLARPLVPEGAGAPRQGGGAGLPDLARAASFEVEADFGAGPGECVVTALGEAVWPEGALAVRIAEIGTNGRVGEWLLIPAGSPYL